MFVPKENFPKLHQFFWLPLFPKLGPPPIFILLKGDSKPTQIFWCLASTRCTSLTPSHQNQSLSKPTQSIPCSPTATIMRDSAFKDVSTKYIFWGNMHTRVVSSTSIRCFPRYGFNRDKYYWNLKNLFGFFSHNRIVESFPWKALYKAGNWSRTPHT